MKIKKSKENLIPRQILPKVFSWLYEKEIIVINGPRQAGKTTLLFQIKEKLKKEKVVYVNFEDSFQLEAFLKSPKDFVSLQLTKNKKTYLLFDEFQYVKNAGKILKLLFDQFFEKAKFIITGSSSLQIKEIASYLVGRAIFFNLYPLAFSEFLLAKDESLFKQWQTFNKNLYSFLLGKKFSKTSFIFEEKLKNLFDEYLIFGGYPAIVLSENKKKQERLFSLIETYIEKDIIKYLKIGNFLEFKKITKVFASQIGNLVNYSGIASEMAVSLFEIKKIAAVLENTFVIKFIPPFYSNKMTEIKKAPKVYFLDLGLRNALIVDFRLLDLRFEKGAMVENFVFQNFYYRKELSHLYFWRTKMGTEVDFILDYQGEIVPFEVKYQEFDKEKISRSFLSFCDTYKPKRGVVLTKNYFGQKKINQTKILFLPVYFI